MNDSIDSIGPGDTMDIFGDNHLTQVQHKGTRIDIVDHHKELGHDHPHTVTSVDRDGNMDSETGW